MSNNGQYQDALLAIKEAVAIYKRLVSISPERYEGDLAESLHNLLKSLTDNGQHKDALLVAEEAVSIYKQLTENFPERYSENFVKSMYWLSVRQERNGLYDDALETAEKCIQLCQEFSLAVDDIFAVWLYWAIKMKKDLVITQVRWLFEQCDV